MSCLLVNSVNENSHALSEIQQSLSVLTMLGNCSVFPIAAATQTVILIDTFYMEIKTLLPTGWRLSGSVGTILYETN